MGEQDVVHLPEPALGRGCLGRFGGELGAGVDVVQRQVTPHVSDVIAVGGSSSRIDALGLAAVRTLEVPVLDQRHRCVVRAADVVVLGIDVDRQVEDVLGGARDLARAKRFGQPPDHAGHQPTPPPARPRTVHSVPSLASSSAMPLNARLETSSDTVKPMPAHAPAVSSTGSLIGERGPCSAGREAIQEPVNTPIGLPTTYPSRIPHVIGEVTAALSSVAGHVDARVGEREQRHDHVARPRVQLVLEPFVGRDRRQQALLRRPRELRRRLLAKLPGQRGRPLEVLAGRRVRARAEPDREAGDHRVDARI